MTAAHTKHTVETTRAFQGSVSAKLKDSLPQARGAYFYFLKDFILAFLVFYPNLLCFSGDCATYLIYYTWAYIIL